MHDHRLRNHEVDALRVGDRVPSRDERSARCTSTSFNGVDWWLCDRAQDHTGEHATISYSGTVLATWLDGDFDALLGDGPHRDPEGP